MSKISVNSDVMLTGVKIYVENGMLFVDLNGEAASNIGSAHFKFSKIQLDFDTPEQSGASAFYFRDGHGKVGYDFTFGDILYQNYEDEEEVVVADAPEHDADVVEGVVSSDEQKTV